jgi:hypothetical protein
VSANPPPSSSLRPPVHGGSGKYVAVVGLLGAGLAGLLLWKSCSQKLDPLTNNVPVTSSVPSNTPPPPLTVDIPPPPDIEDAAGPEAGTRYVTLGNPCEVRSCGGAVTADLETALAFRAKQAHRCYDSALAQDPTLEGHVKISVRVASNGQVCNAAVAANDLANAAVSQCIANMFRASGHFPAPKGGCVDANVPIALLPPGQR